MRILFLSKRVYTNKDLVRDRYGRVYEFSRQLASMGHQVQGLALDYRQNKPDESKQEAEAQGPEWHTCDLFPNPVGGVKRYIAKLDQMIDEFCPDVLLSVSDVYHVIIGDWIARKHRILHVADVYDNYEIFKAARLPGVISQYRRALSRADGVVCVSHQLKQYVIDTCNTKIMPEVIFNAVNKDLFKPHDKTTCRNHFGLPIGKKLIGLGGAMFKRRGVESIFQAYQILADTYPELHLVLAGSTDETTAIPANERIHYLGQIEYELMPLFFCSLDVGIIINKDTLFARYCFPQKFFEMLACRLPMVVASIGDVRKMMESCPQALFQPGAVKELVDAIDGQLVEPCLPAIDVVSWDHQGALLCEFLEKASALKRVVQV